MFDCKADDVQLRVQVLQAINFGSTVASPFLHFTDSREIARGSAAIVVALVATSFPGVQPHSKAFLLLVR